MLTAWKEGRIVLTNIKKARLIKGIQQKELAEQLGISQVSVCKWEQGKAFPNVKRLKQVADILGTSVESLLPDEERAM